MSSKNQDQDPQSPCLPTEVWMNIFRLATAIPELLDHAVVRMPDPLLGLMSRLAIELYQTPLATKRSVVMVCRQWNALATPYLYEYIRIEREEEFDLVLKSVGNPPAIFPVLPLGHYIKRLDLLGEEWEWRKLQSDPDFYSRAPQLCKLSPNLITLNTKGSRQGVAFPLPEVINSRLEHLDWLYGNGPSLTNWITFIDQLPHLTHLTPPVTHGRLAPQYLQGRCWPALKELHFGRDRSSHVNYNRDQIPPGALPSLQRLILNRDNPRATSEFIPFHGQNLTAIHLTYSHAFFDGDASSVDSGTIETLRTCCPRLQELWLTVADCIEAVGEPYWSDIGVQLPGVTFLGLQFVPWIPSEPYYEVGWKWFFDGIPPLLNILPNVRTICLFREADHTALREFPHLLATFSETCRFRNIRLEDCFNRPLN